ncbi:hypothetical protein C9975_04745 [Thalassospira xiamenensis]|nr:hypothetical protein C9975_04745 [Thalassospira xiamenensis]
MFCTESIANHYADMINTLADDVKIGSHRVADNGEPLFKARYLDVIMKLIEYVHMVPASENHHHSQVGGLLRHSIETAYLAMRQADEERPETSRFIDRDELRRPRYIYAAWVAGLLHDTGKVFTDMEVRALTVYDSASKSEKNAINIYADPPVWRPHIEPLISWARENKVTRYRVDYKKRKHWEHDQSSSILLSRILVGEGLSYIVDSPDDLYGSLVKTLTGYKTETGYLAQMVRTGDSKSTARDVIRINSKTFGESGKSTARIISEQAQLARINWNFNQVHGHCWIIGGEVFLRWSSAFNSIAEEARKNEITLLPSSARQLRSMMEDQLLTKPFEREYSSIHFWSGSFTMDSALKIINGDSSEEMKWEELVPIAYPSIVFGYDPIPGNAEGLLLLTQSDAEPKYMIVDRAGNYTEVEVTGAAQTKTETQAAPTKADSEREPKGKEDRKESESQGNVETEPTDKKKSQSKPPKTNAEGGQKSKSQRKPKNKSGDYRL